MDALRSAYYIIVASMCYLFSCYSLSQPSSQSINIPHTSSTLTLDGELTEDFWKNATTIELNIVNFPWNNTQSPIKTTAKVIENSEALLIAFIAEDPDPSKILSFYGDRDTRWDDDLVGIKLDPHNSRRMHYEFITNPVGIQMDAIQNHITGEKNDLWDGIWHSYGRLTANGYIVEMEIPFRILNFTHSNDIKSWAFELFRTYPRDTWLRISHVPLDKDISCSICQLPIATGFKHTNTDKNLMLTPSIVATSEKTTDIYNPNDTWHTNNDIELGLDLRWAISSNTLFNATINPDFSFVETDAGQLDVNENFSLNYDEKRPFFLENSEYFSSNLDLVYTRNLIAPEYGAKLTGTENKHTYGLFAIKDSKTNIIIPGNLSSTQTILEQESTAAAIKYRYDSSEDLSIGIMSTLRSANQYHNYVLGLNTKYQINESNSFNAQVVTSQTQYPDDLYQDFCHDEACSTANEAINRTQNKGEFSGKATTLALQHQSEYWQIDLNHKTISPNFRADLGFIPQVDSRSYNLMIDRTYYAAPDDKWQEANLTIDAIIQKNANDELLEKSLTSSASIDGPYQSFFQASYKTGQEAASKKIIDLSGLSGSMFLPSYVSQMPTSTMLAGNTELYDVTQYQLYSFFKPTNSVTLEWNYLFGDQIDYDNYRLGTIAESDAYVSWFVTTHLELQLNYIHSRLNANNDNDKDEEVYQADLIDARVFYQFNSRSRLKFSLVYCDIQRNLDNNPRAEVDARKKALSTQLIYTYKLNPQTLFYLGYSDNGYQDDYLTSLNKENKTFFTKISYAWLP